MKKFILITGATCELGKAIAQELLRKKCLLILTARSGEFFNDFTCK